MSARINVDVLEHILSDEFPNDELPRIVRALRAVHALDSTDCPCPRCRELREAMAAFDFTPEPTR